MCAQAGRGGGSFRGRDPWKHVSIKETNYIPRTQSPKLLNHSTPLKTPSIRAWLWSSFYIFVLQFTRKNMNFAGSSSPMLCMQVSLQVLFKHVFTNQNRSKPFILILKLHTMWNSGECFRVLDLCWVILHWS